VRVPPWESLGLCLRVTNKGQSGFGKASDRAKAKDLRPQGTPGVGWWGALSTERSRLKGRPLLGSQSLSKAL